MYGGHIASWPHCTGGPSFYWFNSGRTSQFWIERRNGNDLIVLSSDPVADELRVVGRVRFSARVVVSHGGSFDIVARLCSVDGFGRSRNVCEGLTRVKAAPDPTSRAVNVEVDLGFTACSFPSGYRMRLHVCSAAHPRWMKNVGCGDVDGIAEATLPASGGRDMHVQIVAHGGQASHLLLPFHG